MGVVFLVGVAFCGFIGGFILCGGVLCLFGCYTVKRNKIFQPRDAFILIVAIA